MMLFICMILLLPSRTLLWQPERRRAGGGRRLTLVGAFPTIKIESSTSVNCTSGSCNSNTTTTSSPDTVDVYFEGADFNNGEYFDSRFVTGNIRTVQVPGSNPPRIEDLPVDVSYIGKSTLADRLSAPGAGYSFLSQRESPGGDEIYVELTLDPLHRSDYTWSYGPAVERTAVLRSFGSSPWLYTGHSNQYLRLNPDIRSSYIPSYGYRHPVLDEVYDVGTDPGDVSDRDPAMARIRWPANLEDLSWYLFDLPGAETPDQKNWMVFNSIDGSQNLVGAGYTTSDDDDDFASGCTLKPAGTREDISCSDLPGESAFLSFSA